MTFYLIAAGLAEYSPDSDAAKGLTTGVTENHRRDQEFPRDPLWPPWLWFSRRRNLPRCELSCQPHMRSGA